MLRKPNIFWQYQNSPRLAKLLEGFYTLFNESYPRMIWEELDLDKATGYALDLIGQRIGLPRMQEPSETVGIYDASDYEAAYYDSGDLAGYIKDDVYRLMLKVKAYQRYRNTTIPLLYQLLEDLFPGLNFEIAVDWVQHTITIYCDSYLDYPQRLVLLNSQAITVPERFALNVVDRYVG